MMSHHSLIMLLRPITRSGFDCRFVDAVHVIADVSKGTGSTMGSRSGFWIRFRLMEIEGTIFKASADRDTTTLFLCYI